jgi:segregation and condensation protein B
VAADKLKSIIEALLFAGHEPIKISEMREILAGTEPLTEGRIRAIVDELREEYRREERSFTIAEVAGGYRLQSHPDYAEYIFKLRAAPSKRRLSSPALETLAIIAYRQPITKAEIEAIRGVDVDGVLENLIDRELVEPKGRKQAVGKPHLFGTTKRFLEHFGLKNLKDLPPLENLMRPPAIGTPGAAAAMGLGNAAGAADGETAEGETAGAAEGDGTAASAPLEDGAETPGGEDAAAGGPAEGSGGSVEEPNRGDDPGPAEEPEVSGGTGEVAGAAGAAKEGGEETAESPASPQEESVP